MVAHEKGADIQILLSTFNGEAVLETLLESLFNQTVRNWILWIRDDGSKDSTRLIVERWAKQDSRIRIVDLESSENLGPIKSFERLAQRALEDGAPILSFCDQDDRWHPEKLAKTLDAFAKTPSADLFFSDLRHCGPNLEPISPSYMCSMGFHPNASSNNFKHLLCQNFIVGCTLSVRAKLAKLAIPFPAEALMHDWWMGLVCLANGGHVIYLPESLVDYRTHPKNVSGAGRRKGLWDFVSNFRGQGRNMFSRALQAHALMPYARQNHETIIEFIELLSKHGPLSALKFQAKGYSFQGIKRQLGALSLILFPRV